MGDTLRHSEIILRYVSASRRENLEISSQVRSMSIHWVMEAPSGNTTWETGSALIYSNPYSASGSSWLLQIGLCKKIACVVEHVSCKKPGSVNSSVMVLPPVTGRASSTRQENPAFPK